MRAILDFSYGGRNDARARSRHTKLKSLAVELWRAGLANGLRTPVQDVGVWGWDSQFQSQPRPPAHSARARQKDLPATLPGPAIVLLHLLDRCSCLAETAGRPTTACDHLDSGIRRHHSSIAMLRDLSSPLESLPTTIHVPSKQMVSPYGQGSRATVEADGQRENYD